MDPRLPPVKKWTRNKHAIMFQLSNKTVQVIFFDKTEAVLSSRSHLVTYVDKKGQVQAYPLTNVLDVPSAELAKRLRYTKDILVNLLGSRLPSGFPGLLSDTPQREMIEDRILLLSGKHRLDSKQTLQYSALISQLAAKDPQNDLTFLRIRSKKHEIMVAPDRARAGALLYAECVRGATKDYILIVIQDPNADQGS
ncbi:Dynein light chain roadblock-type 2 [Symbiodinium microadriaticum]|uniref:Dynein light chain roadblock-type 2 n=1 Tax=Symbiodinium microadriaticum TaxID=2951 RepID=A0A1Q9C6X8_SYMMI|nr:Dynein light chain roadblock-type 2 [Symbiodinium microadriaticum]